ncbi:uncharacterized protein LOC116594763 [Mustela erminea]|uniref:uncharacterized protein LOC116594763 n=1 Tax=Mustela erminea TaxID=36723 RepID=UPI001386A7A7|nr:uncharacterized protein LOC116594763 [Mustela erminea]XP_032206143.1 uncharacterized protein LOC116594763 [Mustela erminea]XP_032206144.1 uncharacterized protein LOC116594763 [Mustela erminea]XP_032206145.1 uncharacterized protein LOC116594763 [Mustela erminea]XP_032206146.1 uncharacterized protein LOC116594763 [Mustela erminea]XP_032206147.1 uncharacterized protein LOC116594763 [Mustela erminea]XP_032206148.1 uncharacterized protein LOC116594763 [Mustela erminea]
MGTLCTHVLSCILSSGGTCRAHSLPLQTQRPHRCAPCPRPLREAAPSPLPELTGLAHHVPSALRDSLLVETPEHCQSCQTISLPGFYKNPRPRCPMPNTLLRQYVRGLWARPSTAASPRPYIGKSWGIPLPSPGLRSQGGRHSPGGTLGISRVPDRPPPAQGAWGGGQVGGSRRWCPGSCSPSGRTIAGSDQIRPGQRGLARLTGGGLVCSPLPPTALSCPLSLRQRAEPVGHSAPPGEEPPFGILGMFCLEPSGAPFRTLRVKIPRIPAAATEPLLGPREPLLGPREPLLACLPAVHVCPCPGPCGVHWFMAPVGHQSRLAALPGAWSVRSKGEASQGAGAGA